jgi:hypothetical protein
VLYAIYGIRTIGNLDVGTQTAGMRWQRGRLDQRLMNFIQLIGVIVCIASLRASLLVLVIV